MAYSQETSFRPTFRARDIDILEWKGDMVVLGVTVKDTAKDENNKFKNPILNKLDSSLGGLLAKEHFTGKAGRSTVVRLPGLGTKRVSLIGLGQQGSNVAALRSLGEVVAKAAKEYEASKVAISLASPEVFSDESKPNIASAIASGTILGISEDKKKSDIKSVEIIGLGSGPEVDKKLKYAQDVSSGIILGRELFNAPSKALIPGAMAVEAKKIASAYSDVISATILNKEQCKKVNMGSKLGVAAASTNPPYIIHLRYKPPSGPVSTKLGLVGKGITLHSGGHNIKTEMGGSIAVLGAAKAIGENKPLGVEVHFVIAVFENMIHGIFMRPDVNITASNQKTIEGNKPDVEGRLALADAFTYTCKQGVDKIVYLPTQTSGRVIAHGPSIGGIFTANDDLAKELLAASESSGEKLWRMPLEKSYWESMKSCMADMFHTGGCLSDTIAAALFLKQFVDEKVQGTHMDVADVYSEVDGKVQETHLDEADRVFSEKKHAPSEFGVAHLSLRFGVATLVEWVLMNAS